MLKIHFENQKEGEKVMALFHIHPVVFANQFVPGVICGILPFFLLVKIGLGSLFYLLGGILWMGALFFFLRGYFLLSNNIFIITNLRAILILQKGFFVREIKEVYFQHACQVEALKEGALQSLLDFGRVTIQTETVFQVENIEKPYVVKRTIFDLLHNKSQESVRKEKTPIIR